MRKKRLERELNYPHFVGVRLSDIELELLDRKAEILCKCQALFYIVR